MKSFIRKKLPYILIVVQAVLILGILLYIVPGRYRLYDIVLYDESENVPANPLTGYAPRAENLEDCAQTNLVFISLPFSEWEPQEGVFDTASLEKKYHLEEHRKNGRHAVLRFVCDVPSKTAHRDIPQWLYEKTADGIAYRDTSGSGYAPDYANAVFMAEHEKALRALADWCRKDHFVAYVEIGSVGQNGNRAAAAPSAASLLPSEDVLARYIAQYTDAFPEESGIRLLGSAATEASAAAIEAPAGKKASAASATAIEAPADAKTAAGEKTSTAIEAPADEKTAAGEKTSTAIEAPVDAKAAAGEKTSTAIETPADTVEAEDSVLPAGIGSWDDILGDPEACALWVSRTLQKTGAKTGQDQAAENGSRSGTAQEQAAPDKDTSAGNRDSSTEERILPLWAREPVGGGMTTKLSMDELLMDSLSDTLEQLRACHISFIGPECPDALRQHSNGSEMILRNVGYCIYLSRLQTTVDYIDDDLLFHFTFVNTGSAPLYWDWPVTMYIYDSHKNLIRQQTLDLALSSLLPGEEKTVTGSIPYSGDLLKGYRVGISITDPEGTEYITLAQKGVLPDAQGIHKVYQYLGRSR